METSWRHRLLAGIVRWRIVICVAFVIALLSAPFVYRSSRLVGLPDIGTPFDVEEYGTVEITDAENAFVEYNRANPTDDPEKIDEIIEQGWSAATPAARKWVEDNQRALELLEKGAMKPKALIDQPKDQSVLTTISVKKHRAFSRLARLQAAREIDLDDVAGAWKWYRIAFRHSRHVGMYDEGLNRSFGATFHRFATRQIVDWSADVRVDSALLRRALQNIMSDYRLTQPASTTLRSEYFDTMNWINQFEMQEYIEDSGVPEPVVPYILYLKNEPEVGKRVIKLVYANWLSQIDLPPHQKSHRTRGVLELFEPVAGDISAAELEQLTAKSPVAAFGIGRGCPLGSWLTRERNRQSQLEVVLAAQLYYRENGRFPESPAELLDGYLSEWPIDLYVDGESPMKYRIDTESGDATVWSVGPNGINGGGNVETNWSDPRFDIGMTIRVPQTAEMN